MWCDRCRADAAAEISLETDRATCATCGHDLGPVRRPATEHARELLKKWSAGVELETAVAPKADRSDAPEGTPTNPAAVEPVRLHRHLEGGLAENRQSVCKVAPPPSWQESSQVAGAEIEPVADREAAVVPLPRAAAEKSGPTLRIDSAHREAESSPHFDVHLAVASRSEKSGQGTQVIGQILAYAGVLALTVGTALVIWSYFGGNADDAPTGWLVATGGQMLLYLGVVTLVAGGLEQTSRDVKIRVDLLGERLSRLEQRIGELSAQGRPAATDSETTRLPEKARMRA